jgi:hypothetical protein
MRLRISSTTEQQSRICFSVSPSTKVDDFALVYNPLCDTCTPGHIEIPIGVFRNPKDDLDVELCCGKVAPEPGSLVLFGSGVLGLTGLFRRKLNL